jgi:hypothetical protein
MKQAEYWFGDFTREQEAQIRQASDARVLNNEMGLQLRMRRQQEMVALLKREQRERPGPEATMAMLKNYANGVFNQFGDKDQQAYARASREAAARMTATIINMTTPQQKAHAKKRLQGWIEDFRTLARHD